MKAGISLALAASLAFLAPAAGQAQPAMDLIEATIAPLFSDPKLARRLPEGVKYFFAEQPAEVVRELGPTRSFRMTVRGARTKKDACRWALLSTLKAMGEETQKAGGNAVVGIYSKVRDGEFASETSFRCVFSENTISVSMRGTMAVVK